MQPHRLRWVRRLRPWPTRYPSRLEGAKPRHSRAAQHVGTCAQNRCVPGLARSLVLNSSACANPPTMQWIVRPSAVAVVGQIGMNGQLRQLKWLGGATNLGVWVDCKTMPKGACDQ
jgi:hypothetical protein